MPVSGGVVVLVDVGAGEAGEPLVEIGCPLAGAAGIGGRDQTELGKVVGILFALAHFHGSARRCCQKLGQAIRDRGPVLSAFAPLAVVKTILRERLVALRRHVFVDPEIRRALEVAIDELGHLAAARALAVRVAVAVAGLKITGKSVVVAASVSARWW